FFNSINENNIDFQTQYFFFQAEDGIRDRNVTGVQTCALPIYQKPSPESDPYVAIGDKVEEESIVCIVEAMKLFNEIEAELNGEIVEILVNDGDLVEYGQPLFKVKT